jgi:peptidoglycan/xylan/chitin deacetylase (PgdA/CDA1 family)
MMNQLIWKALKVLALPFGRTPCMGSVTAVQTTGREVALTFDDGPHPEWTPRLLDLLRAHNAKASFFVVGEACEGCGELLEQVVREGHALCNHSWSHLSQPLLSGKQQRQEILRCAAAIGPQGHKLFRPPYGHQSPRSRWNAFRCGHEVVTWSSHIADWRNQSVEELSARLKQVLKPGGIILMHDGMVTGTDVYSSIAPASDRGRTIEALSRVLSSVEGRYEFVTLPELLRRGTAIRQGWFRFNKDVS